MPRCIDTHAHLDFEQFDEDREDVVEKCRSCLHAIVNPGTDLETSRNAVALHEEYPDLVAAAAGMHPTTAQTADDDAVETVAAFVRDHVTDLVAVGEIGMDFHHAQAEAKRERQQEVFHRFLELAEDLGKPVIVHSRDAEKHCVKLLGEYDVTGVLHCFNGIPEYAEQGIENGCMIGVSTQVLYSSAVRQLVRELSLDNLVLETDAPFLYRGERNHPAHVKQSAQEVSDIKNVSVKQVVQQTTENARALFPGLDTVLDAEESSG